MGDWEDFFGVGVDDEDFESFYEEHSPSYRTRKHCLFKKKQREFNSVMIRLGFKWCLKYGVFTYPRLSCNAIFIDRVQQSDRTKKPFTSSRLIIDQLSNAITVTMCSRNEIIKRTYSIKDKNAFKNAMLIAMDFKFNESDVYFNKDSFLNSPVYTPLKIRKNLGWIRTKKGYL